jgi:DNA transformation protein
MPDAELIDHCLELLAPLGAVRARRMFGGHGLYVDDVFLALIAGQRLYLKTDALSRPHFEAAACEPFVYRGHAAPVTIGYWTVPPQAMESPQDMLPWARLALDAALRARQAKPTPRQRSVPNAHQRAARKTTRSPR